ncbi:uncharacterized protein J7T54_008385 [Emericellopsis cladophorae]|uniref:Major facilitator superfamily (MFS) profile domain-containing protein n=1 Tax=Emericellopsis cladophorae TaxID=2686198 RepID=A0A9Q0BFH2_9HYPO|nr:uncharacterized protein J7T54_008385 [Emericellopsis cladophorae]KAI6782299.1 hypothetical protein J7T54_008385 [Emericellopsis cladophorae]
MTTDVERASQDRTKDIKPASTYDVASIKPTAVEATHDLDAAEIFLREHNYTTDQIEELLADGPRQRRLVRKIDMVVLPLLAVTYVLQYIDKQAMSYAAVFDLFESTNTNQTQYGWMASIFYLAYLVSNYPWVALAQRTRMGKVVAGCVLSWGGVLMLTAVCHNFPGLAACRFFLGFFESPITTCFMMTVAMWYTRSESPFRAGIFYCCNGVGSMLGGIFSYGIGHIEGFAVWKAIFLVTGGLTVLWGIVLLLFFPDSILTAKFFTNEEKALLIGRARLAKTGVLNQHIRVYQIREAFSDPQVWLLVFYTLLNETVNGGVANFGKLIVKGVARSNIEATALGIPQGAFQVFWILSGTYLASRWIRRTTTMALYLVPTIVGTCLMWKMDRQTDNGKIGVLLGYYCVGAYVASLVLALQMPSVNLSGYTKRITASAMVFSAYCAGNIIGPHAFLAEEAPLYPTGCKVILACVIGQVVAAGLLRLLLVKRNKDREAAQVALGVALDTQGEEAVDLTDFENPHFRYVY